MCKSTQQIAVDLVIAMLQYTPNGITGTAADPTPEQVAEAFMQIHQSLHPDYEAPSSGDPF